MHSNVNNILFWKNNILGGTVEGIPLSVSVRRQIYIFRMFCQQWQITIFIYATWPWNHKGFSHKIFSQSEKQHNTSVEHKEIQKELKGINYLSWRNRIKIVYACLFKLFNLQFILFDSNNIVKKPFNNWTNSCCSLSSAKKTVNDSCSANHNNIYRYRSVYKRRVHYGILFASTIPILCNNPTVYIIFSTCDDWKQKQDAINTEITWTVRTCTEQYFVFYLTTMGSILLYKWITKTKQTWWILYRDYLQGQQHCFKLSWFSSLHIKNTRKYVILCWHNVWL